MRSPGSSKKIFATTSEKEVSGPTHGQASASLRYRIRHICIHLWIWELLSLLLCVSCVGTIVVILIRYNGRPLPDWKYGLTINGVISVLAGVAKASMILPVAESISQLKWHWFWNGKTRPASDFEYLDTASRGPWGCLVILCRPQQWSLVSLGALVTVLALLMEPSLQFIPSYPLQQTDTGHAFIPRSTYYNDVAIGSTVDPKNPRNGTIPTYNLGPSSKNGVFSVLYGGPNRSNAAINPTCPSGNCTWPEYSSLAVCTSCTNLTSDLRWKGLDGPQGTGWTLPNGEYSYPTYYFYMEGDFNYGTYWSLGYNRTVSQNLYSTYYFENEEISGMFTTRKPTAFECSMYICVKRYSATMVAGVFSEHVESSWPGPHEELPGVPDTALDPSASQQRSEFQDWTLAPPDSEDVYRVSARNFLLLKAWLSSMLARTIAWASSENNSGDLDTGQAINELRKGSGTDESYPAKRIMDAFADGLTMAVRDTARAQDAAVGTSRENRAFVKARWWFAVLPVTLVAMTCSFMAATLFVTVRYGVPVWKSSALASLAHGFEDCSSDRISAPKLDEIERKAKTCQMSMKAHDQRWRLQVSPGPFDG